MIGILLLDGSLMRIDRVGRLSYEMRKDFPFIQLSMVRDI